MWVHFILHIFAFFLQATVANSQWVNCAETKTVYDTFFSARMYMNAVRNEDIWKKVNCHLSDLASFTGIYINRNLVIFIKYFFNI